MIVQTQASILTQLMTADCRQNRAVFVDIVQDALTLARETALTPTDQTSVTNDRTALPLQKRL